jgi:mRNA interferase MazF
MGRPKQITRAAAHALAEHHLFIDRSSTVIAVALASQPRRAGFPLTLEFAMRDLPKRSWVKIRQIPTLSVERIGDASAVCLRASIVIMSGSLNLLGQIRHTFALFECPSNRASPNS